MPSSLIQNSIDPGSGGHSWIGRRALRGELEVEVFERNLLGRAFYAKLGFELMHQKVHDQTGFEVMRLSLVVISFRSRCVEWTRTWTLMQSRRSLTKCTLMCVVHFSIATRRLSQPFLLRIFDTYNETANRLV